MAEYQIGTFLAKPTNKHGMIGENGKERYLIEFEILEGADKGRKISYNSGFSGEGSNFTLGVIEKCGWDRAKYPDFTECVLDKQVNIVIGKDKDYTDKNGVAQPGKIKLLYVNGLDEKAPGLDIEKQKIDPKRASVLAREFAKTYAATQAAKAKAEGNGGGNGGSNEYTTGTRKTDTANAAAAGPKNGNGGTGKAATGRNGKQAPPPQDEFASEESEEDRIPF